jgi:hypothetical protein
VRCAAGPRLAAWRKQQLLLLLLLLPLPLLLRAAAARQSGQRRAPHPAGRASGSSGGYLTLNFVLNCVNWLVLLFLVLLISAFTV